MDPETALLSVNLTLLFYKLVLLQHILEKRRKKRIWVRDYLSEESRLRHSDYYNLMNELRINTAGNGLLGFVDFLRVTPRQFDELLNLVGPIISKRCTGKRSIPAGLRLGITLRYLSTGDLQKSQSFAFRVSRPSVSNILRETCKAIWQVMQPIVLPTLESYHWKKVMEDYWNIWNFPNCIGAIDGKHIDIVCPSNSGSYYNYKGTFSIVMLAACDANYKFTYVDIGSYGSLSDGGIFFSSKFGRSLRREELGIPEKRALPYTREEASVFFVADEAFGLSKRVMRPYSRRDAHNFSQEQKIFNYRLSRARRTIENTFGHMSCKWRLLHKKIFADVRNIVLYVQAIVCLHNYLKIHDDTKPPAQRLYFPPNSVDQEDDNGHVQFAQWRNDPTVFARVPRLGSNNATREAYVQRDILAGYLASPFGSVPWQDELVNRGRQ